MAEEKKLASNNNAKKETQTKNVSVKKEVDKTVAKESPIKKESKTENVSIKKEVNKTVAKESPIKKEADKTVAKESPIKKEIKAKSADIPKLNFDLPKNVFGIKINQQAIFDAIMSERASLRQGTHSTKTRAEVSGGGRKPWRQKGTGNARQGSIRSPQWVGGGIVFGPKPNRNYTLKVNKKVKKIAYNSAFTLKAKGNAIAIKDFKMEKPSTKELLNQLSSLKINEKFKKLLIVTSNPSVWKSASNLEKVFATRLSNLTVESIINADLLIFENQAMTLLSGKGDK